MTKVTTITTTTTKKLHYPKIFVLKMYQSYKNANAQHIGNKNVRHPLRNCNDQRYKNG